MPFDYLPGRRNCSFPSQDSARMYADCKEKLAYNVPFITAIPGFVIFGQPITWEKVTSGVGIGF
jgi:hypothetical protein